MKKTILLAFLLLTVYVSNAQAPTFINYQAVARYNNTNIPIPHQLVHVDFKLRQGTPNGTVIFQESQSATTDDCGLFNMKIGAFVRGGLAKIDWSSGSKFLEVTINDKVSGITELASVPYALHADRASYADSAKNSGGWTNIGDTVLYAENKKVGINVKNPQAPFELNGYMRINGNDSTSTKLQLYAGNATKDNWITSFDENGNRLWVLNLADRSRANTVGLFSEKMQKYVFNVTTDGHVGVNTDASSSYALTVNGEMNVSESGSVKCLTIKGGCDWYEESHSNQFIEPGYVVIIDENGNPNSVKPSTHAYDKMVVGVVSGAGGINPGLGLKQEGILEGNTKVAMGGKVKVHVVGNVKAGDLLTSSGKAGYAMTVKNRKKAFGAVLGKALSLPDENGLVLMHVMMQ